MDDIHLMNSSVFMPHVEFQNIPSVSVDLVEVAYALHKLHTHVILTSYCSTVLR